MKCICCDKKLKSLSGKDYPPETDMWNNAGVHTFIPGYGSKYDSDRFVVGICDKCIKKKLKKGVVREK